MKEVQYLMAVCKDIAR